MARFLNQPDSVFPVHSPSQLSPLCHRLSHRPSCWDPSTHRGRVGVPVLSVAWCLCKMVDHSRNQAAQAKGQTEDSFPEHAGPLQSTAHEKVFRRLGCPSCRPSKLRSRIMVPKVSTSSSPESENASPSTASGTLRMHLRLHTLRWETILSHPQFAQSKLTSS